MSRVRVFLIISFVMLCAAPSRAQSCSPTDPSNCLYVSTLAGEQIIAVDRTTGAKTVLVTEVGSRYEDLVVGPDLKIYACDATSNRVKRFDLNGGNGEVVYQGVSSPPLSPQCGRFSHAGDFYLNTKSPNHSGVWKIAGVAQVGFGGPFPAPVNVVTAAQTASNDGEGLAIAPNGDLLIAGDTKILKSVWPAFGAQTSALASSLANPIGLARDSAGNIYFTLDGGVLRKCNPSGGSCSSIATFSPGRAYFLEFDSSDNLYVATARDVSLIGPENGKVWKIAPGGSPVLLATLDKYGNKYPPASGLAMPPTTRSITKTFQAGQVFNYGSHFYTLTASTCQIEIRARQATPAEVNVALASKSIAGTANPYLGEGGFAVLYELFPITPTGCQGDLEGMFTIAINAFLDNFSNPRVVRCEGTPATPLSSMTPCTITPTQGAYPISLPPSGQPGDPQIIIRSGGFSSFFVINETLATAISEAAVFCGVQSPLLNISDPALAPIFNSGQTVSVKFKLATLNGNCQNGPWVTSALALLSVARIKDANGNDVFEPIAVFPAGQSSGAPLFSTSPNNQQYSFSLSLQGYLPGTYSLSILFLTNNTVMQTTYIKVQ